MSEPIEMQCPSCGDDVRYVDEETVECVDCGWRTDPYEAMKAAENEEASK